MPKEKLPVMSNYIVIDDVTHSLVYAKLAGDHNNCDRNEVVMCREPSDNEFELAFVTRDINFKRLEDVVNYIQEKETQGYEINMLYIRKRALDLMGKYYESGGLLLLLERFPKIKIKFFTGGAEQTKVTQDLINIGAKPVDRLEVKRIFTSDWSLCNDERKKKIKRLLNLGKIKGIL